MTSQSKSREFFAGLLPAIAAFAAYLPALAAPFHFDDKKSLLYSDGLHRLADFGNIIFFDPNLPRPLFYYSLALDWHSWGAAPFGFHLTNVIIHVLATVLLFDLMRRLMGSPIKWPVIGAVVFAVHPAVTESVTYIWSRSSELSAVFWLLAADLYYASRREKGRGIAAYTCSIIAFLPALASKEIAATLPAALLLIEYVPMEGALKGGALAGRRWLWTLPFFIIVSAAVAVRIIYFGQLAFGHENYLRHLGVQTVVAVSYLKLLIWPIHLDVDRYVSPEMPLWLTAACGLLLAAIAYAAFRLRKRLPGAAIGIGIVFIALSPFYFIPLKERMVERSLYYPAMGFALFLAVCLKSLSVKFYRQTVAAAAVIVALLFAGTINRNMVWGSEKALWTDAIQNAPDKARPYNYLAALYIQEKDYDRAWFLLEDALRRSPDYAEAHHNIGIIAYVRNDLKRAAWEFAMARAGDPYMNEALNNQAKAEIKLGNVEKARSLLETSLERAPGKIETMIMLAELLRKSGDSSRARELFEKAYGINPQSYEAVLGLGLLEDAGGNTAESLKWLNKAVEIDGSRPEAHRALGRLYGKRGDWERAVQEFQSALEADPDNPDIYKELGISLMRLKKYDEARKAFTREMQIRKDDPEPLLRLASIEEARGNIEDAIKLYNRAMMLDRKGRYTATVNQILKKLKETRKIRESRPR